MTTTAKEVMEAMIEKENPAQREVLMGFFKTGKGQYGEGDEFLGLKVPETRAFVKDAWKIPLEDVQTLIDSKWHEVRLCGFLILVEKYGKKNTKEEEKQQILDLYLKNTQRANNWDLVDLSCYKILGQWLVESPTSKAEKLKLMDRLALSENLWEKRISMVSTMATLMAGDPSYTIRYALLHIHHPHDLMHKAIGWMLREMGKRCSMDELRLFLKAHSQELPRTALRYAIEKMSEEEKTFWMIYGKS